MIDRSIIADLQQCIDPIASGSAPARPSLAFSVAEIDGRLPRVAPSCLSRPDIFAPALVQVGLGMDWMIFVESNDKEGVVKNAKEGLRYRGVAVVVAEFVRLPMVASRRFQSAAQQSGDRPYHSSLASAARSDRLRKFNCIGFEMARVSPSKALPVRGVGRHRWRLKVMRIRAAESFEVEVNACDATGHMTSIEVQQDPWRAAI